MPLIMCLRYLFRFRRLYAIDSVWGFLHIFFCLLWFCLFIASQIEVIISFYAAYPIVQVLSLCICASFQYMFSLSLQIKRYILKSALGCLEHDTNPNWMSTILRVPSASYYLVNPSRAHAHHILIVLLARLFTASHLIFLIAL